jgi:cellulose synthase (UDP-forming)
MQLGIVGYVREVESAVREALKASTRLLAQARRTAREHGPAAVAAIEHLQAAVALARRRLAAGDPVSEVTYTFQRQADEAARALVDQDMEAIRADLRALEELPVEVDEELGLVVIDDQALDRLADRDWSPLGAVESVRGLLRAVDVDRVDEAQPMMPLATVSVTEDMATCMRLHALGWRSVYHHEVLAHGLAPEDLRTMMQQRLRWAQGTLQVMLRENPLLQKGLSVGQRLMYLSTMWSYLSGFAALAFLAAPVLYLLFDVLPVQAYGLTFLSLFLPYVLVNQVLFLVVGYGVKTWRGHQYSLALFPLWIRACTTAVANVVLGRPLGFVVTPKTRRAVGGFPWRLVLPQLVAVVVLVVAVVVGVARLATGSASSTIGTAVNVAWVGYDLVVLSVIFQAARYRAPEPAEELVS